MVNWMNNPSRLGLIVYIVILWFLAIFCRSAFADDERSVSDRSQAIQGAILSLVAEEPTHTLNRDSDARERLALALIEAGDEYDVSPYLLLVMAYRESSLKMSAIGKLGEKGLFQLHGVAKETCPEKLSDDPITHARCGARWLRLSFAMCGGRSWENAVAAYGAGRCNIGEASMWAERARARVRMAGRLERKWDMTPTKKSGM
jgi:soluble lytic murein transglycosylase-like protein